MICGLVDSIIDPPPVRSARGFLGSFGTVFTTSLVGLPVEPVPVSPGCACPEELSLLAALANDPAVPRLSCGGEGGYLAMY